GRRLGPVPGRRQGQGGGQAQGRRRAQGQGPRQGRGGQREWQGKVLQEEVMPDTRGHGFPRRRGAALLPAPSISSPSARRHPRPPRNVGLGHRVDLLPGSNQPLYAFTARNGLEKALSGTTHSPKGSIRGPGSKRPLVFSPFGP